MDLCVLPQMKVVVHLSERGVHSLRHKVVEVALGSIIFVRQLHQTMQQR